VAGHAAERAHALIAAPHAIVSGGKANCIISHNKAKHEAKMRQKQSELLHLVQGSGGKVEWDAVRKYMFMDAINPNTRDRQTRVTTLHLCASDGETDVLNWCIQMRADINAQTALGRTPLHHACAANKTACMRMLLKGAADVNARTLSYQTPLHVCSSNSYHEATSVLLYESPHAVDVDAEDSNRQIPEELTTDQYVIRGIKKYRVNFDAQRRAELVDQALQRLFNLFDRSGEGTILPQEWADSMSLLAERFDRHIEDLIDELFEAADANQDGKIDWPEFRAAHVNLIDALGVPFRDIMNNLNDLESAVFQEKMEIEKLGDEAVIQSPVLSERAKTSLIARETRHS